MRVLVAPDKFAGTLSANQAALAVATGWRRRAPDDELDLAPMSDGGPGFVDVLAQSLGGELHPQVVSDPYGAPTPGAVLVLGDVAYVESSQACGLQLTVPDHRRPEQAHTRGVGELMAAAVDAGARTVVVGLGGSGTNDGGAGLLAALGALADVPLDEGAAGLAGISRVDIATARRRVAGVRLIAATDVTNPLTGLIGATNTYAAQKGLPAERIQAVDALLAGLAAATDRRLALAQGAGAAGGLGFALMLLGAERVPGVEFVSDLVHLPDRARKVDLVLTGEGAFDFSSRAGKVPYGVAQVAAAAAKPCIVLAGQVLVGSREMRALGVESAYAVSDLVGPEASSEDAAGSLARLAERVARSWSR